MYVVSANACLGVLCTIANISGEVKCFRIGCTPTSTIDTYLEEAKKSVCRGSGQSVCPVFQSRRSSALRSVAKILDNGGVVGTPTDTVTPRLTSRHYFVDDNRTHSFHIK